MGKKKSAFVQQKEGKRLKEDNYDPRERLRPIKGAREKDEPLVKVKNSAPYSSKRKVPGCGPSLLKRPARAVEGFYQEHHDELAGWGVQSLFDLTLFIKVRYSPAYHVPRMERGSMDLPCVERKLLRDVKRYYVTPPPLPWQENVRLGYTRQVRDYIRTGEHQLVAGCVPLDVARQRRNEADGQLPNFDSLRITRVRDTAQRKSSLNGANGEATNKDDVDCGSQSCEHPWCNGVVVSSRHRLGSWYVVPHLGNGFLIRSYEARNITHVAIPLDEDPCDELSDDCFCVSCIVLALHNLHTVASQINGVNGEATNTDDLDRANAARRVRMEARNHQHQRPVPNGRADPNDQAQRPVGAPRNPAGGRGGGGPPQGGLGQGEVAQPAPAHARVVGEPVIPVIVHYVESMGSILVDGVLSPPRDMATIAGGTLVANVVGSSDGIVRTQDTKGTFHVAAAILAEVTIPAYTTYADSFPAETYVVFYPLLRVLQKQLAGKQSPNTPFACSSLAQKLYPRIPQTEIKETIQYFLHLNEYANAQNLRGNNLVRRMIGTPVAPDTLMANQVMELHLVRGELPVNPREFIRAPAGRCEAPFDWPLRTDFIVLQAQGTTWDGLNKQNPSLLRNGYFHFNTEEDRPKWYRSEFFSFNGLDQVPFVQYDKTGHNAACALKRLVGARADQQALQAAQQTLIPALFSALNEACTLQQGDAASNLRVVLRALATTPDGVTARYERQLQPLDTLIDPVEDLLQLPLACQCLPRFVFDLAQQKITRLHAQMIYSTCRSTMQRILDGVYDSRDAVKEYLYDIPFKAMGEFFSTDQQRLANAEVLHAKRDLRRAYVKGVLTHLDEDLMVRRLDAQLKNETAKFRKASRFFVSYDAGAMYANDLPDYLKKCISGWHDLGEENGLRGVLCLVTSTKSSEITSLFARAFVKCSLPNTYLAIAMSDDMNEFANLGGVIYGANTDVESNDSSNGAYPFSVYGTCVANFNLDRGVGIVKQCMEPVVVRNPSNPAEVLKINMVGPLQGSGTLATTGLNNINSMGTCVGTFTYLAYSSRDKEGFEKAIAAGAASCGHTKTVQWCESNNSFSTPKVQFLKHSPLRCWKDGECATLMVQNLGCLLRNLGKVDGDLTAAQLGITPLQFSTGMSDDERADRFFSAVVSGYKNNPTCPVLKALRSRFCYQSATHLPAKYRNVEDDKDMSGWIVDSTDLCERYDLDESELAELVDLIERTRVGYTYTCRALSKIYAVDYGMPL